MPKQEREALEKWGFALSDFGADDTIVVWPENVESVQVFLALRTQWRVGMNGRTGLDYGVLPEVWRRLRVRRSHRDNVFRDLTVMEHAALLAMREKDDDD